MSILSELRKKKGQSMVPFHEYFLGGVLKRGQSAVEKTFRPVTSGGTVFTGTLTFTPFFTSILSELRKKGQKYDTFSRVFSRWGVNTT